MDEIKLSKCPSCSGVRCTIVRQDGEFSSHVYAECGDCGGQTEWEMVSGDSDDSPEVLAVAKEWADMWWTRKRVLALANYIAREAFDAGQDDIIIPSPMTPADKFAENRAGDLVEEFEAKQ